MMQYVMAGALVVAVILIVEDDVFIREIAEMMIQDLGHHILSASDVDEALLRGGPGCLNRISASISGASAGVRLPSGGAAA